MEIRLTDLLPFLRRSSATPPPAPANALPAGLELPDDDDGPLPPGRVDDDLWGCTFAIAYVAESGRRTVRRVTMHDVFVSEAGAVMMRCICHERQATRTFRLDRIAEVIDLDGVVHAPAGFFTGELQMRLPASAFAPLPEVPRRIPEPTEARAEQLTPAGGPLEPTADVRASDAPGYAQRRAARDGLRVLCALARADGLLHDAEVEVVLDYIAWRADAEGIETTEADRAALKGYVRRQRPTADVLSECLARLAAEPATLQRLFLQHAVALAEADGLHHEAEFTLLLDLREAIGGGD